LEKKNSKPHDVPLWTFFKKKKNTLGKMSFVRARHSRPQKIPKKSGVELHSTFFWDFLRRTRKVTRYPDALPNLGLLGPKNFTFAANISKVFVPKTGRKREFNGKMCPFPCLPPPMVTQTTQHPVRWKAHDKTQTKVFFFKKKF
jgi:hypothetical protein